jgi:urea transporter
MTTFLKNWNAFRAIRLIVGITALTYGIVIVDWLLIMVGIALGFMAIANAGCSPFSNSCEVEIKKDNEH